MPLGPHVPEWEELHRQLLELVTRSGALHAVILDESNCVWCASHETGVIAPPTGRFYEREIANRTDAPLRRGGRLSVVRSAAAPEDSYLAESFGIYVLVVWFAGEFEHAFVRARIRRELPRIEALTTALPPPDGPEPGSGSGKIRA